MLAPNGTRTLATEFWSHTSELDYAGAAPYALLMVLASLPLTLVLSAQVEPTKKFRRSSLKHRRPSLSFAKTVRWMADNPKWLG